MPALVVSAGGTETRHALGDRPFVVGRSVECDLQLDEVRASRKHFRVEPTDRGWRLVDLESSNGTALNGYAVAQALLAPGDVIEVGEVEVRFEGDGPQAPRTPRPPRPRESAGLAWIGVLVAAVAAAAITDSIVVAQAEGREKEVRTALDGVVHRRYLLAAAETGPARAEAAFAAFLRENEASPDAPTARARLEEIRAARAAAEAAVVEWDELQAQAPGLAPDELRWRTDRLVRRWAGEPATLAAIRRRTGGTAPSAGPAEDPRVLFARRKREADAAMEAGEYGRALSLWDAHATACPPADRAQETDLRTEIRRVEDAAAGKAAEALGRAAGLEQQGKAAEADGVLREAAPALEGTSGGRRVRARIERGGAPAGATPAAPGKGAAAGAGVPGPSDEGYARRRAVYLRAREAEQFVALRDYDEAARRYEAATADAATPPEMRAELESRTASLRRVAALLSSLRDSFAKEPARAAAPGTLPAAEVHTLLLRVVRTPGDRLTLAAFAYDQGLRKEATAAVVAALADPGAHAEAEALYAAREGVPVPEGGFLADRGEVVSRAEANRRRNAEKITELQRREDGLLKRLRETSLVKGVEKIASLRAEMDRRRAAALDLIFDEKKYFYPYRDRMKEYEPVQREVDHLVEAVREVWESKVAFRTKAEGQAVQVLKDLDAAVKELRDLGAEPTPRDLELEVLRRYFDRDLNVQNYFTSPEDLADHETDAGVLRENQKKASAATTEERRQVEVTNLYRIMMGRRALRLEDRLVMSARGHCEDMVKGGWFDHFNPVDPRKRAPDDRIRLAGYEPLACSENILLGKGDPEGAHAGWLHSSGHHRNILNAHWKDQGSGRSGGHWTQNFGIPLEDAGAGADAGGPDRWDRAGGRGDGEDGNDPGGR